MSPESRTLSSCGPSLPGIPSDRALLGCVTGCPGALCPLTQRGVHISLLEDSRFTLTPPPGSWEGGEGPDKEELLRNGLATSLSARQSCEPADVPAVAGQGCGPGVWGRGLRSPQGRPLTSVSQSRHLAGGGGQTTMRP